MDTESISALEKYNGRILAIEITGTGYHFHIRIADGGVNITEASVHEPDSARDAVGIHGLFARHTRGPA